MLGQFLAGGGTGNMASSPSALGAVLAVHPVRRRGGLSQPGADFVFFALLFNLEVYLFSLFLFSSPTSWKRGACPPDLNPSSVPFCHQGCLSLSKQDFQPRSHRPRSSHRRRDLELGEKTRKGG